MKTRHSLLLLVLPLLVLLVLSSCDALSLQEEPQTFLTENSFYQNAADAEAALLAAYQPFQQFEYYRLRFLTNLISMSDYADGRGSYGPGAEFACDQTCKDRLWGAWSSMYEGINQANAVIAKVPEIDMAEQQKEVLIAEAHFIRALNYYNLVRYWGGVPLRTEPTEGLNALSQPRASVDEVYQQIISDLEFAEERLPATPPGGIPGHGRASSWAAIALQASVHLARENWGQASDKAKEIIDNGPFSLVEVDESDDFEQLFGADVVTSSEEIFDIPFSSQDGYGFHLPSALHISGPGYSTNEYHAVFASPESFSNSFLSTWDPNDLRRTYNLYVGDDAQYNIPTEVQHFRKFIDRDAIGRNAHSNDFPVLRYAEMLLIFAEAETMENGAPTAAAYEAINRVRRRAYGVDLNTSNAEVDLPQDLDAQAFRDSVIQERAFEFLVEGKRYWDLKRTGTLIEKVSQTGDPVSETYMLWPIPREELDANEALTLDDQNPGW